MMSILEALRDGAQQRPDRQVWTFLNDKGDPVDSYTYKELDNASSHLAEVLLTSNKLIAGDRVLLVFFPGLDFTVSLLACFKAGLIGVPVFPPDPRKMKKDLHHFVNIQLSCGAHTVLTNSLYNFAKKVVDLKNMFSSEAVRWPELKWISVDDTLKKGKSISNVGKKGSVALPTITKETIAFLQYTSGSTSDPKGVIISHENLAHNLTLIIKELKADKTTINVSWLPQYHDMGLIGSYMGVVYCGGTGYYISPISFLKDPVVWVKALSRFKGTHTQAPNFAYPLVSRKFKEALSESGFQSKVASKLDLSSLRHMINAAEPVDFHAIMEFYACFGAYGLPNNVVIPTYGLAEHTVFVCSGGKQVITVSRAALEAGRVEMVGEVHQLLGGSSGAKAASSADESEVQQIVGCGYPTHGQDVQLLIVSTTAIANTHTASSTHEVKPENQEAPQAQPEGVVGEIWIASPSKAQGYWNQAELSQHEFHAPLPSNATQLSPAAADGFLRTGDLGFMLNAELFICGRVKDLIIVRGSNHYPQDIERTAEQHQAEYIRAGCSAAFSLKGSDKSHTEDVIYIAELKEGVSAAKHEEIARAVREIISTTHGLALSTVCLLRTRSIPKTTSGKIARSWCRRGFLEKTLQIVYRMDAEPAEVSKVVVVDEDSSGDLGGAAGTKKTVGSGTTGYSKVHNEETGAVELPTVHVGGTTARSAEEVRALPIGEVQQQLEHLLVQVAAQGPSPLTPPLDTKTPVSHMGLDSMTLVQFKGVLEKRFHCNIPDDFLFTSMATLEQLALSVHEGKLTSAQKEFYDGQAAAEGKGAGAGQHRELDPDAPSTEMSPHAHKQPCCPWFTWCM